MITVTHANGYTGELRDDGALFVMDPEGNEIMTSRQCFANSEESLMEILSQLPTH